MKSLKGGSRNFQPNYTNPHETNPHYDTGRVNFTSNTIGHLLYNMEEKPSNEWNPSHNDIEPDVLFTELQKYNLSFYFHHEYDEINNRTQLNPRPVRMGILIY